MQDLFSFLNNTLFLSFSNPKCCSVRWSDGEVDAWSDMEKGADTRTLSAEIFENCGNFLIVEDYAPLFLVEMIDETFNIWHIYNL